MASPGGFVLQHLPNTDTDIEIKVSLSLKVRPENLSGDTYVGPLLSVLLFLFCIINAESEVNSNMMHKQKSLEKIVQIERRLLHGS